MTRSRRDEYEEEIYWAVKEAVGRILSVVERYRYADTLRKWRAVLDSKLLRTEIALTSDRNDPYLKARIAACRAKHNQQRKDK